MRSIEADYVVVGAGALGMAFTDALTDHADVRVLLVDRRHAPGGHWLDAYPFVRLHQASAFYGVASTLLGDGRVQRHGPEEGLHERATAAQVLAYYESVLAERMLPSGRVTFLPGHEWTGEGGCRSLVTGERVQVRGPARVVDARYHSPRVPAVTPPPFAVEEGAHVVPVGDLVAVSDPPPQYVVVGSGKTATDACTWLLAQGVAPDAICWVRPREPWMLDRAVIQPAPHTFLEATADIMETAAAATSMDEVFLGLEERGVLLRIDRGTLPTMARTPTLARWELDALRTIEHVVRLGHVVAVEPGRLVCAEGTVGIRRDALVVNCTAPPGRRAPTVPIWRPEAITLQAVRAGFPCFGAAITGFVEATVPGDATKNALCPATPDSTSRTDWLTMQALGARAEVAFGSHPDIRAWASTVALNPARLPAEVAGTEPAGEALARVEAARGPGVARMAALAGLP